MAKTYTYDPAKINENGKDRMRFELGDTMVEGGAETCALTDEEYNAIIGGIRAMEKASWSCSAASFIASHTRSTKVGPFAGAARAV